MLTWVNEAIMLKLCQHSLPRPSNDQIVSMYYCGHCGSIVGFADLLILFSLQCLNFSVPLFMQVAIVYPHRILH